MAHLGGRTGMPCFSTFVGRVTVRVRTHNLKVHVFVAMGILTIGCNKSKTAITWVLMAVLRIDTGLYTRMDTSVQIGKIPPI